MQTRVRYSIFGYSDYIKNSLGDVINRSDVDYFDSLYFQNPLKQAVHRVFISRHVRIFSKLIMPLWKNTYWSSKRLKEGEVPVLIMYEINPLSNKQQWIRQIRKDNPQLKIVYIFTNIIDEHRMWRIEQIQRHRELYDLVLTFNKADAEKYNMDYYEGVFSPKVIEQQLIDNAESSDVYFCGVEKGRLSQLISIYDYLSEKGLKCKFDVINVEHSKQIAREGVSYHDSLIRNDMLLANVIKSRCILEVMVDRTQPGSSLRMCESIAYEKKLLTNNLYACEKPFYNSRQMYIFDTVEDIDVNFIFREVKKEDFLDKNSLSPVKLLEYIYGKVFGK